MDTLDLEHGADTLGVRKRFRIQVSRCPLNQDIGRRTRVSWSVHLVSDLILN